ncbi:MAG TPA: SufD family Fe-S cluster assembly protein [Candidatus Absconditabacterales bacterium]|nr:SufD family Fe-S cluster assembly protein [Candidatus Absconditabacterales bacterium]
MDNIIVSGNEQIIKKYNGENIKSQVSTKNDNIQFKYLIFCSDSNIDISFYINSQNIKGDIFVISYGKKPVSVNLLNKINGSDSIVNVLMLSFIQSDNLFDIQGSIKLGKNIQNSQGHLLEKNIVLGEKIKIKALPRLDVYSNNVKATHGVSIEKINKDNMFYLESKGLQEGVSKELIIRGNIKNILNQFTEISQEEKDNIENQILSKISPPKKGVRGLKIKLKPTGLGQKGPDHFPSKGMLYSYLISKMEKYFDLLLELLDIQKKENYKKIAKLIAKNSKAKFNIYHKHGFIFEGYQKLLNGEMSPEDFAQLGDFQSKIKFDQNKIDSISFLKSNPKLDKNIMYVFDYLAKGIIEESDNIFYC